MERWLIGQSWENTSEAVLFETYLKDKNELTVLRMKKFIPGTINSTQALQIIAVS